VRRGLDNTDDRAAAIRQGRPATRPRSHRRAFARVAETALRGASGRAKAGGVRR
jgi:hypothetical protein